MLFDDLFVEAERQLNVCNSCRYCEGYCPVWPALTLRTELPPAELTHLANLCHDCRDCFTACMYTAPHEFDINPPAIFAALRERTYQDYVWPGRAPRWARGRRGIPIAFGLVAILIVALGLLISGRAPYGSTRGSAYELLEHWVLVGIVAAPAVWSVLALLLGARRYWADTHGPLRDLARGRLWLTTLGQAARLTHQSGGGSGCDYPDDSPSMARRGWHHFVSYGFGLTFVSTISAGVSEYFFGDQPPYGYLSVPVITGTVGGVAMIVGCVGLLALKRRADPAQITPTMRAADHGFIGALLVLSVTGLLVLVLRTTPAFAPLLVVHLAAVIVCFGIAPYTKFVHWIYRLLAIYQDNFETDRLRTARRLSAAKAN